MRASQIVWVQLTEAHMKAVLKYAGTADLRLGSNVFAEGDWSKQEKAQICGQMGELAARLAWPFDFLGFSDYIRSREERDRNPTVGDRGVDFLDPYGVRCDVKCSLMRYSQDPLKYKLLVPKAQMFPETERYVQALVKKPWQDGLVALVGWLPKSYLLRRGAQGKTDRKGARYDYPCSNLYAMQLWYSIEYPRDIVYHEDWPYSPRQES